MNTVANTKASVAANRVANRVANLMARSESFAFRLAALNAMGGERASYPAGEQAAKGKPKPKPKPNYREGVEPLDLDESDLDYLLNQA